MRLLARASVVVLAALTAIAVSPIPVHADEVRENQWMLDALDIEKVHELTQGEGVTVGIVDTGVDATHPDIKGNVVAGMADWDGGQDGLKDTMGHGTAMASIIAGHGHGEGNKDGVLGIAPKAKVKSVSIYPTSNPRDDPSGSSKRLIDGIRWLADAGVDVISVSQGNIFSDGLENAVTYAVEEKDIPVVASAGNNNGGPTGDVIMTYPAAYESVFGITGSDKNGGFWKGSAKALYSDGATVAAPAEDVVHAWKNHGYDDNSGTSDSAAIVAGTVALMKAQWPDMPWELIEWRLALTADDKGEKGPDRKFGWGIVNPLAALTEDVELPDGYTNEEVNPEPYPRADPSDSPSEEGKTLSASSGSNPVLWISIAAAVAVLTAAAITVVAIRRRKSPPSPPSALD